MSRRILVPMDGSPTSKDGLRHAVSTYPNDDIIVLHVMTPVTAWNDNDPPLPEERASEWTADARNQSNEVFNAASDIAGEHGVNISTELEMGEPWRTIVTFAEENEIDHIIMGSHGLTDDPAIQLGSVAETVVRRSPVLVSIVR